MLENANCMKRISDSIFEYTNDFVEKGEIYDAEVIYDEKKNIHYLSLGYDNVLDYEIYIQIKCIDNKFNINSTTTTK